MNYLLEKFIKLKLLILICIFLNLYFVDNIYSQNYKNITNIGKYSDGPSFAVTTEDSTIYLGNGCTIDIIKLKANIKIENKSKYVSNFLINDIKVRNNILYVATDGGMYIINAENNVNPYEISYFETEGKCNSIFTKENYAYLVDDEKGVQIIEISELSNPTLISIFKPDSAINITNIFASDSLIYLCDSFGDLFIIDVNNKNNPVLKSKYTLKNKQAPTAITIKNNYAFICTTNKSFQMTLGNFIVLDISNPDSINQVYSNYIPGDWSSSGRDVFIEDSILYIPYSSDVGRGVEVYNISTPTSPKILNSVSVLGVNGISTSDSYSVSVIKDNLIVSEGGFGMSIFSVTDFNLPKKIISYQTCDTVNDLFVENNTIYAACGYSGFNTYEYLNLNEIKKTTKPKKQKYSLQNNTSVYADNGLVFLTNTPAWGYGFQIFNVNGTSSYQEIGGSGNVEGVKVIVKGNYAYVAARFYGLVIFDISDYSQPKQIFNQPFEVSGLDLVIEGNNCFMAAGNDGIFVFDIFDPANPKEIFHFKNEYKILDISVKDSIIFAAEGQNGLRVLNYLNTTININYKEELSWLRKLSLDGDYLYIVDDTKGLVTYNISNPLSPEEYGYYNLGKAKATNIIAKDKLILVSQRYYGFSIFRNDMVSLIERQNEQKHNNIILYQNYPNPFNHVTKIEYFIAGTSFVTLKIFDILGREVQTLVEEEKQTGNYEIEFDGSNLSSGVYFYRMQAGNFAKTKRFTLLK